MSGRTRVDWLDLFKAASTFISSVIIALAGIYVTQEYNSKQLEISQRQVDSQIEIARNRELTLLIPQLGDKDAGVKRYSAISLALYGRHAVPALIAALDEENEDVQFVVSRSLSLIPSAAPDLIARFKDDRRNTPTLRSGAIYTLGLLGVDEVYGLASTTLRNSSEDPIVRKRAAEALGVLKDERAVALLLDALRVSRQRDAYLTAGIIWALRDFRSKQALGEISSLLNHPDEEVRFQAVWAIASIADEGSSSALARVAKSDSTERVRAAARNAQIWAERVR